MDQNVFERDTMIKGKMHARLAVRSDCEDTCFYLRVSVCKAEGDYGMRDDITQISNYNKEYRPGDRIALDFSFDEIALTVRAGERIRIDISSSAYPHYLKHTNLKGNRYHHTKAKIARNTVILEESTVSLPIVEF